MKVQRKFEHNKKETNEVETADIADSRSRVN